MAQTVVHVGEELTTWRRCGSCGEISFWKKWRRGAGLCPLCGHHGPLTPEERIDCLADDGTFEAFEVTDLVEDPLGFVDTVPYPQRLASARERTGRREAVVVGAAEIDANPVVLAVLDFRFLGGSLGVGMGERLTVAAERALATRTPLVLVTASGGARMQEGVLSLMQMAKVSQAIAALREAGVGTLSLVADPTYGGVAASFATQTDVIVAEPGARLGFAGPRVIRQTIGRDLPPGFQTAEFLHGKGMIDRVVPRPKLRDLLATWLELVSHPVRPWAPSGATAPRTEPPDDPWTVVRLARDPERPTVRDYLARICESFVELHGDRLGADSPTIVGGLARIAGRTVVVVGTQKGHSTEELVATSFGMAGPDGYRKAQRLFALAERLSVPVVTLIDTPGAHPGTEAEEQGQALAIADSILRLTALRVPVIAAVVGEGGSGGALALAVGDRVLMGEHAVYSVISPEGCAAILWGAGFASVAAGALRLTAPDLLELGVVDRVVPEPAGGTQADHAAAAAFLTDELDTALRATARTPADELVARRRARLRNFGRAPVRLDTRDDIAMGAAR